MKSFYHPVSIILCMLIMLASSSCGEKLPAITDMTVEYSETPLGIDSQTPRFGWQIAYPETEKGVMQTAFQIVVTDESGKAVWDSGKTENSESQNIGFTGETLSPTTRYTWALTVWDNKGNILTDKSWFETGLMSNDGITGWNGAKWIGGEDKDMVLYSNYLPVFKMNLCFQLNTQANDKKIGFIYGANDPRLMDSNKNIYHLANAVNESFVKIEFDLSPVDKGKHAIMNIYRAGYHKDDKKDVPLHSFTLPASIVNKNNLYSSHCFTLYSNLGYTRFLNGETEIGILNINPIGRGGDYIAFPVVGDVGFSGKTKDIEKAEIDICNFRSPENKLTEVRMDPERLGTSESRMYVTDPSRNSMPMLRTTFSTKDKKISKARIYATARGIYELYLNGERIGNDYFNPGVSQFNKTHFYQSYDVTGLIKSGKNAWGALLGEGWWSGAATYTGENWNYFGDRQSLLAELVITYDNGETQTIVTDPETWKYYADGPVIYGSFFQGEVYDAGKEEAIERWSTAEYNDKNWTSPVEVSTEGHVSRVTGLNQPAVDDYTNFQLISQYGQTIRPIKTLTAQSVEEVRPGVYVYDMGQNMVGVPQIRLEGMEPGKTICMRYAEVRYPDLPQYAGNEGMVMLENIRAAMAQDLYVTKGGNETISPRFTYHGYRFIEITGIGKALPAESVKGIVLSSIDGLKSSYHTSNDKVNRLWNNIVWSTYANFFSIPTDCPQRNERLGWAGDISVFSRTSTYLAEVPQFLRRYLRAMRDVQREDGRFPDVAPLGGGFGGLLWGSAGITVPWEIYQQYGDKAVLAEHYDAMCRYISFILNKNIDARSNIIIQEDVFGNLGDWLGPEDQKNDKSLMWEAYFLYDLDIMSKVASVLGKEEDAEKYRELYNGRKKFFNETYINKENGQTISSGFDGQTKGKAVDIQTSYVLPLAFGIVDDDVKEKFIRNLANSVTRENVADDGKTYPPYSLMTGFIGTAWISKALSDYGYNDIAYRLLQQTSYPSWLYPVEQGATTIWERLNSYTHVDGFGGNNRMNSFNHYSFGAVGAWMYAYSLGIMRDEESPGFKHFILSPVTDPTGEMTFAEGYYESLYGRIESSWKVSGETVIYEFTVPANTTATLRIPVRSLDDIKENGTGLEHAEGISDIKLANGAVECLLGSGHYRFEVKNQK